MLKASPISLNAISYNGVIRMLETIRDISPNPPCVEHVYVDTGTYFVCVILGMIIMSLCHYLFSSRFSGRPRVLQIKIGGSSW
jgi:hypothetical protein